jgi:hypothetical protein
MIDDGDCGEIGGMKIGKGTEVLGENLPQHHIVHPGRCCGKPATNRLSYGGAQHAFLCKIITQFFE